MTTRLPSTSGALPEGETPGCDVSDIYLVHRIFRWGFREFPTIVRGVDDGDVERAATVSGAVELLTLGLHVHHEGEDALLWDPIEARRPACAVTVELMREQHARIATMLDRVPGLAAEWREGATTDAAANLAAALDEIGHTLGVHLGREESDIVPVAAEVMSQREWDALGEHGREDFPKEEMPIQLGLMIEAVPEAERAAWFKRSFPAPIRLLWALLMRRKYVAWQHAVFPEGMPALV
ncbi:hemerythrin domain-containing protein [Agromyces marinus]|uniref:Hemerythrin-like domain-containing protein n=1 Tax=Agromyces marinus TaxID=1389020 RepID=A0ABN6YLI4_9MICO|nr:hemerythrin domain-containing protein [Agromyces marinus]UIP58773.1 hypothetical protein DSM26151_16540 [Agromyces marinus]BDZ56288.1 hypothetical protein GCM10025870_33610 [Agromyces marinus]